MDVKLRKAISLVKAKEEKMEKTTLTHILRP